MGSTVSVHRSVPSTVAAALVAATVLLMLSSTGCSNPYSSSTVLVDAFTLTNVPYSRVASNSRSSAASSSSSSSQLMLAFRNFHSDYNRGTRATQSDRARREEERRTYERHKQRRRQFEQRQQQQRMEREEQEKLEYERRQEQERQARIAGSISFIALHEHEEELRKEQERFEGERADLKKLIVEQRRQLDALRQSDAKLSSKRQLQIGHYNHFQVNPVDSFNDMDNRIEGRTVDRFTSKNPESSSVSSFKPSDSLSSAASKPIADVNLSMLWSENQRDKMIRMAESLRLLKEENERLSELLEIEMTRFAAEKVFMEQKLLDKDAEIDAAKDELRIEREIYETTIALLEKNLEREQKKVRALENAVAAKRNTDGDYSVDVQDNPEQQHEPVHKSGQIPGSTAAYHQQTEQQSIHAHSQEHQQPHQDPSQSQSQLQQHQQHHHQQQPESEPSNGADDIPVIEPEPVPSNAAYGRKRRQTRNTNYKYYQPPDQEQYEQQPDPAVQYADHHHGYSVSNQQSQQQGQYQYHSYDQFARSNNINNSNHQYNHYNNVNAATPSTAQGSTASSGTTPTTSNNGSENASYNNFSANYASGTSYDGTSVAATSTTATATEQDDDSGYYYYRSYRSTPSQQRRANSAMPRSMRADQPYPNGGGGGGRAGRGGGGSGYGGQFQYGTTGSADRRYRYYRSGSSSPYSSSTSSSSVSGSRFRSMGDVSNRFFF